MGGFLNYLDDFDKKIEQTKRKIIENNSQEKSKVLAINVEVRTVDGAKLVIEKLQNWIAKVESENGFVQKKQSYRIPPKKMVNISEQLKNVKNVYESTSSHASSILDGIPENPEPTNEPLLMNAGFINNGMMPPVNHNLNSVAGHASALL